MSSAGAQVQAGGSDWYEPVVGDLEQGDVLFDFPLVLPKINDAGDLVMGLANHLVLVLTQTCDIPKSSQKTLLLVQAVAYDATRREPANSHLNAVEYRNALASGTSVSDFLLPPSQDGSLDYTVVHFRNLFVLPKNYVLWHAPNRHRLRLMSPYKEHFAQAYGRFMMRVGLPYTLHDFTKNTPAKL